MDGASAGYAFRRRAHRIYVLADAYLETARYVSSGNAHRICQHVDTYSAARQYASGRRGMLKGRKMKR